MMGACSSTCCSKDSDELPKRNTESWGPMNERWGKAVLKNNLVGCQYVHADDPNVIDQVVNATTGERAIHVAVSTKNVALFQFLAQYQVDVNVQTVNHETPLHIAAKNNDTQSIKMLLALGADQDIKNGDNKLAKDLCDRNIRREFTKSKQKMLMYVENEKDYTLSLFYCYCFAVLWLCCVAVLYGNVHVGCDQFLSRG